MKIELERYQLINLIMACTAADAVSTEGTKKWNKLHDQLKAVLIEYDSDVDAAANVTVNSRRVYKVGEDND